MKQPRQKFSLKLRVAAAAMVFLFGFDSAVWAAPPEVRVPSAPVFSLPPELGTVEMVEVPEKAEGPLVIHIQDAHTSPEAQEKILEILKYLNRSLLLVVATEGARGPLHPEYLDLFPLWPRVNEAIVSELAAQGILSGAELFAWEQYSSSQGRVQGKAGAIRVVGAETTNFYLRNLKAYRDFFRDESLTGEALGTFARVLDSSEAKIFNPPLRKFIREIERKKDGRYGSGIDAPNLSAYLRFLAGRAFEYLGIDLRDRFEQIRFPHLTRLLFLLEFEKRLYPRRRRILQSEIKAAPLFEEMALLEEGVLTKLVRNDTERDLLGVHKDFRLLEKLFHLELTREEYEKVRQRRGEIDPLRLGGRLGVLVQKKNLKAARVLAAKYAPAFRFYHFAEMRDRPLLENALKEAGKIPAPSGKKPVVALVTGGFHTSGLSSLMKEKGIAHAVVTPRLVRSDFHESSYHDLMMGNMSQLAFLRLLDREIHSEGKVSGQPEFLAGLVNTPETNGKLRGLAGLSEGEASLIQATTLQRTLPLTAAEARVKQHVILGGAGRFRAASAKNLRHPSAAPQDDAKSSRAEVRRGEEMFKIAAAWTAGFAVLNAVAWVVPFLRPAVAAFWQVPLLFTSISIGFYLLVLFTGALLKPFYSRTIPVPSELKEDMKKNWLSTFWQRGFIPPLVEEPLFRGILPAAISRILGGDIPWLAGFEPGPLSAANVASLAVASLGFALADRLVNGPNRGPVGIFHFILGMSLGMAYLVTGNLMVPILVHVFNNTVYLTWVRYNAIKETGKAPFPRRRAEVRAVEQRRGLLRLFQSVQTVFVLGNLLGKRSEGRSELRHISRDRQDKRGFLFNAVQSVLYVIQSFLDALKSIAERLKLSLQAFQNYLDLSLSRKLRTGFGDLRQFVAPLIREHTLIKTSGLVKKIFIPVNRIIPKHQSYLRAEVRREKQRGEENRISERVFFDRVGQSRREQPSLRRLQQGYRGTSGVFQEPQSSFSPLDGTSQPPKISTNKDTPASASFIRGSYFDESVTYNSGYINTYFPDISRRAEVRSDAIARAVAEETFLETMKKAGYPLGRYLRETRRILEGRYKLLSGRAILNFLSDQTLPPNFGKKDADRILKIIDQVKKAFKDWNIKSGEPRFPSSNDFEVFKNEYTGIVLQMFAGESYGEGYLFLEQPKEAALTKAIRAYFDAFLAAKKVDTERLVEFTVKRIGTTTDAELKELLQELAPSFTGFGLDSILRLAYIQIYLRTAEDTKAALQKRVEAFQKLTQWGAVGESGTTDTPPEGRDQIRGVAYKIWKSPPSEVPEEVRTAAQRAYIFSAYGSSFYVELGDVVSRETLKEFRALLHSPAPEIREDEDGVTLFYFAGSGPSGSKVKEGMLSMKKLPDGLQVEEESYDAEGRSTQRIRLIFKRDLIHIVENSGGLSIEVKLHAPQPYLGFDIQMDVNASHAQFRLKMSEDAKDLLTKAGVQPKWFTFVSRAEVRKDVSSLRGHEVPEAISGHGLLRRPDGLLAMTPRSEVRTEKAREFRVKVKPDESYGVKMTRRVFSLRNLLLQREIGGRRAFFVIDGGIGRKRIREIRGYMKTRGIKGKLLSFAGGEQVKDGKRGWANVLKIHQEADKAGLSRKDVFVVVGGGAVLDVGGYAASSFHRGIPYLRIPTTLLSQIDAGIGVKTGINYFGEKNFLGAFYPPQSVLVDPLLLESLGGRDFRSGISEAIKVALMKDGRYFRFIERNYQDLLDRNFKRGGAAEKIMWLSIVRHLEQIKTDPFERRLARPLDYGHEWGHRLEAVSKYRVAHGEGVTIGMAIDTHISYQRGYITGEELERVLRLIENVGLPIYDRQATTGNLWPGLESFRKHLGGRLTISLLEGIGAKRDVHKMKKEELRAALAYLKARSAPSAARSEMRSRKRREFGQRPVARRALLKKFREYRGLVYYPFALDDITSVLGLAKMFPKAELLLSDAFVPGEAAWITQMPNANELEEVSRFLSLQFKERYPFKDIEIDIKILPDKKLLGFTLFLGPFLRKIAGRERIYFEYQMGRFEEIGIKAGLIFVKRPGLSGRYARSRKFWTEVSKRLTEGGYVLFSVDGRPLRSALKTNAVLRVGSAQFVPVRPDASHYHSFSIGGSLADLFQYHPRRAEVRANKIVIAKKIDRGIDVDELGEKIERGFGDVHRASLMLAIWLRELYDQTRESRAMLAYLAAGEPIDLNRWVVGETIRFTFAAQNYSLKVSQNLIDNFKPLLIAIADERVDLNELTYYLADYAELGPSLQMGAGVVSQRRQDRARRFLEFLWIVKKVARGQRERKFVHVAFRWSDYLRAPNKTSVILSGAKDLALRFFGLRPQNDVLLGALRVVRNFFYKILPSITKEILKLSKLFVPLIQKARNFFTPPKRLSKPQEIPARVEAQPKNILEGEPAEGLIDIGLALVNRGVDRNEISKIQEAFSPYQPVSAERYSKWQAFFTKKDSPLPLVLVQEETGEGSAAPYLVYVFALHEKKLIHIPLMRTQLSHLIQVYLLESGELRLIRYGNFTPSRSAETPANLWAIDIFRITRDSIEKEYPAERIEKSVYAARIVQYDFGQGPRFFNVEGNRLQVSHNGVSITQEFDLDTLESHFRAEVREGIEMQAGEKEGEKEGLRQTDLFQGDFLQRSPVTAESPDSLQNLEADQPALGVIVGSDSLGQVLRSNGRLLKPNEERVHRGVVGDSHNLSSLEIIDVNRNNYNPLFFLRKYRPDLLGPVGFAVPHLPKGKVSPTLLASQFRRFPWGGLNGFNDFLLRGTSIRKLQSRVGAQQNWLGGVGHGRKVSDALGEVKRSRRAEVRAAGFSKLWLDLYERLDTLNREQWKGKVDVFELTNRMREAFIKLFGPRILYEIDGQMGTWDSTVGRKRVRLQAGLHIFDLRIHARKDPKDRSRIRFYEVSISGPLTLGQLEKQFPQEGTVFRERFPHRLKRIPLHPMGQNDSVAFAGHPQWFVDRKSGRLIVRQEVLFSPGAETKYDLFAWTPQDPGDRRSPWELRGKLRIEKRGARAYVVWEAAVPEDPLPFTFVALHGVTDVERMSRRIRLTEISTDKSSLMMLHGPIWLNHSQKDFVIDPNSLREAPEPRPSWSKALTFLVQTIRDQQTRRGAVFARSLAYEIKRLLDPPNASERQEMMMELAGLKPGEARSLFGKALPAVMALVATLAPSLLSRIEHWDNKVYAKLQSILADPEMKGLFIGGETRLLLTDSPYALVLSKKLGDRQITVPLYFADGPAGEDGKAWFTVLDPDPLGIPSLTEQYFEIFDHVLGRSYRRIHAGPGLREERWRVGIPVVPGQRDRSGFVQEGFHFQILEARRVNTVFKPEGVTIGSEKQLDPIRGIISAMLEKFNQMDIYFTMDGKRVPLVLDWRQDQDKVYEFFKGYSGKEVQLVGGSFRKAATISKAVEMLKGALSLSRARPLSGEVLSFYAEAYRAKAALLETFDRTGQWGESYFEIEDVKFERLGQAGEDRLLQIIQAIHELLPIPFLIFLNVWPVQEEHYTLDPFFNLEQRLPRFVLSEELLKKRRDPRFPLFHQGAFLSFKVQAPTSPERVQYVASLLEENLQSDDGPNGAFRYQLEQLRQRWAEEDSLSPESLPRAEVRLAERPSTPPRFGPIGRRAEVRAEIVDYLKDKPVPAVLMNQTTESLVSREIFEHFGQRIALDLHPAPETLAIGAGFRDVEFLLERYSTGQVSFIDLNLEPLEKIEKYISQNFPSALNRIRLIRADASNLKGIFEDQSFDLIYASGVNESTFMDAAEGEKVLSAVAEEEARLLRSGGILYHPHSKNYYAEALETKILTQIDDPAGIYTPSPFFKKGRPQISQAPPAVDYQKRRYEYERRIETNYLNPLRAIPHGSGTEEEKRSQVEKILKQMEDDDQVIFRRFEAGEGFSGAQKLLRLLPQDVLTLGFPILIQRRPDKSRSLIQLVYDPVDDEIRLNDFIRAWSPPQGLKLNKFYEKFGESSFDFLVTQDPTPEELASLNLPRAEVRQELRNFTVQGQPGPPRAEVQEGKRRVDSVEQIEEPERKREVNASDAGSGNFQARFRRGQRGIRQVMLTALPSTSYSSPFFPRAISGGKITAEIINNPKRITAPPPAASLLYLIKNSLARARRSANLQVSKSVRAIISLLSRVKKFFTTRLLQAQKTVAWSYLEVNKIIHNINISVLPTKEKLPRAEVRQELRNFAVQGQQGPARAEVRTPQARGEGKIEPLTPASSQMIRDQAFEVMKESYEPFEEKLLRQLSQDDPATEIFSRSSFEGSLADDQFGWSRVYLHDGKAVGFVIGEPSRSFGFGSTERDERIAMINEIGVKEEFRGRGIMRELIYAFAEAVAATSEWPVRYVIVAAAKDNVEAADRYEHYGFKKYDEVSLDEVEGHEVTLEGVLYEVELQKLIEATKPRAEVRSEKEKPGEDPDFGSDAIPGFKVLKVKKWMSAKEIRKISGEKYKGYHGISPTRGSRYSESLHIDLLKVLLKKPDLHLPFDDHLTGTEILILGAGMGISKEIQRFLELFPGIRTVHIIEPATFNLGVLDGQLSEFLEGKDVKTEFYLYRVNALELPAELEGRIDIVEDKDVFDTWDDESFSESQINQISQEIRRVLKPFGLHVSTGNFKIQKHSLPSLEPVAHWPLTILSHDPFSIQSAAVVFQKREAALPAQASEPRAEVRVSEQHKRFLTETARLVRQEIQPGLLGYVEEDLKRDHWQVVKKEFGLALDIARTQVKSPRTIHEIQQALYILENYQKQQDLEDVKAFFERHQDPGVTIERFQNPYLAKSFESVANIVVQHARGGLTPTTLNTAADDLRFLATLLRNGDGISKKETQPKTMDYTAFTRAGGVIQRYYPVLAPSLRAEARSLAGTVLKAYDLGGEARVENAAQKNVFIIRSKRGKYLLKQPAYRNAADLVDWEASLLEALKRGGLNAAGIVKNKSGNNVTLRGGRTFVLYEYLEGKDYDWGEVQGLDLKNAAQGLALMHDLARKAGLAGRPYSRGELPQVIPVADVELGLKRLERQYAALKKRGPPFTSVEGFFVRHYRELLPHIQSIRSHLNPSFAAKLPKTVVHGDYHQGNLKFRGKESPGVFDFEFAHEDARIYDLANGLMIGTPRRDGSNFNFRKLRQFLKAYQEKTAAPLTRGELSALADVYRLWYLEIILLQVRKYAESKGRAFKILQEQFANLRSLDSLDWQALTREILFSPRAEVRTAEQVEGRRRKAEEEKDTLKGVTTDAISIRRLESLAERNGIGQRGLPDNQRVSKRGTIRPDGATAPGLRVHSREPGRRERPVSQEGTDSILLHRPGIGLRSDDSPSGGRSVGVSVRSRGPEIAFPSQRGGRNAQRLNQGTLLSPLSSLGLRPSSFRLSSRRAEVRADEPSEERVLKDLVTVSEKKRGWKSAEKRLLDWGEDTAYLGLFTDLFNTLEKNPKAYEKIVPPHLTGRILLQLIHIIEQLEPEATKEAFMIRAMKSLKMMEQDLKDENLPGLTDEKKKFFDERLGDSKSFAQSVFMQVEIGKALDSLAKRLLHRKLLKEPDPIINLDMIRAEIARSKPEFLEGKAFLERDFEQAVRRFNQESGQAVLQPVPGKPLHYQMRPRRAEVRSEEIGERDWKKFWDEFKRNVNQWVQRKDVQKAGGIRTLKFPNNKVIDLMEATGGDKSTPLTPNLGTLLALVLSRLQRTGQLRLKLPVKAELVKAKDGTYSIEISKIPSRAEVRIGLNSTAENKDYFTKGAGAKKIARLRPKLDWLMPIVEKRLGFLPLNLNWSEWGLPTAEAAEAVQAAVILQSSFGAPVEKTTAAAIQSRLGLPSADIKEKVAFLYLKGAVDIGFLATAPVMLDSYKDARAGAVIPASYEQAVESVKSRLKPGQELVEGEELDEVLHKIALFKPGRVFIFRQPDEFLPASRIRELEKRHGLKLDPRPVSPLDLARFKSADPKLGEQIEALVRAVAQLRAAA